jgi:peptidoglycan/LPS O-acetylase OafA/YrhL
VSSNLDLLRAIAVIAVVLSHLPPLAQALDGAAFHLHSLGVLGVCIFFVHTCYVLMLSMQREGGPRLPAFFIRRALRVYPLSIAVVLIAHARTSESAAMTLSNLLLVQNLTGHASLPPPLWSLPYEVQMYLVLPALYALSVRPLFALWTLAAAASLGLFALGWSYHLLAYVPCFMSGVIAFKLPRGQRSPLVLFAYVAALAVAFPWLASLGAWEEVAAWPLCLGLGALIAKSRELRAPRLAAVAKVIARYSYGVYLMHSFCIELAFVRLRTLQWPVFIASLCLTSYAAYHLIEKRGIALGVRLTSPESSSAGAGS